LVHGRVLVTHHLRLVDSDTARMLVRGHVAMRAPPHIAEKVANREIRVWHFVVENGY
jgi:Fe-S cluster assembly ATPase SufC